MFFLAVFLVIPVYADVDLDEFKSLGAENIILTSDFEVSSSFSIDVTDSSYKISEVDIEVKLKPVENFQQEVISTDISSNGKETPDSFVFNWKGLGKENIDYSAKSRIKTNNPIPNKINGKKLNP